jgi:hypothetical protein
VSDNNLMYFISNTYTNVTVSIYGSWVVLNLFTCKFLCQPKNILKYVMHLLYEKKAYTVMVKIKYIKLLSLHFLMQWYYKAF